MTGRAYLAGVAMALLGSLLGVPEVRAQGTGEDRGAQLAEEARALFNARRFDEASSLFLRAFDIDPRSDYLYNAGRTAEVAGTLDRAVALYQRYTKLVPPPDDVAAIEARIGELEASLSRTHALLDVSPSPPEAVVTLDGVVLPGPPPYERWVPAGPHQLRVQLDGYEASEQTLTVAAGERRPIQVALAPAAVAGTLVVRSNQPDARVFVDDLFVGVAPVRLADVAAGEHDLRIQKDGMSTWSRTVDVRPDQVIDIGAELVAAAVPPPAETSNDALGWAGIGVGAALLVTGGVLHGLAFDAAGEANALPLTSPTYATDFDGAASRGEALEITAYVGYGLGAAALGAGITLLATGDAPEPAALRLLPLFDPVTSSSGFGIAGGF